MAERRDENEPIARPQEQTQTAYRAQPRRRSGYQRQSVGEAIAKSFLRSIASSLGRILARAITGRMR
jgi:Bacterial protein of unknown function (DUF853)